MISTQYKQRTNNPESEWRSCKSVTLRDGVLHCLLESEKPYVLMEAYEDNLHVRFANADSDKELMDFISAWGPLWIPSRAKGLVPLPLARCRAYQKQVKALIGVLTACKLGQGEREALAELLRAYRTLERLRGPGEIPAKLLLPHVDTVTAEEDWAERAPLAKVRDTTNHLVEAILGGPVRVKLSLLWSGKRRQVLAGWNFWSLMDALHWMVWYDEFTKHPVLCCAECREVFRGETARPRKYCSVECGHRATAREAMRKKRAAERTGRK